MLENLYSHLQQIATLQNMDLIMVIMISSLLFHMIKQIFIICYIKNLNLLFSIKNLHSKTNILTYTEIIKQTVKNYEIINLFLNKISQNCNYILYHCNDCRNQFHFACRQWYLYNNPQCNMV